MVQDTVILLFGDKKAQFGKEFQFIFKAVAKIHLMHTTRTSGKVVYKTNRAFK